ncbi:ParB-like partition protein [Pseudomonas phage SM1]|uniref:DNA replication protein n=2 Tax=Samunavirus TaxID=2560221 RepID=A0AAU8KY57_9CAUD|nr:ParB-like partition protein [Pseudomonas phage SM1]UGC97103.1 hypothetical protein [Pseudomonas phage BHU-1]UGV19938.1 hypothetical protein [Pseudomonas phage Pa BHU-15]UIW13622.1 hypothetical protein [Pseudomonas phage Pa BHU-17]UVN14092.1 type II adenine-specific methyltransferase [Pseudomonas phage vB_PaeS_FBPa45]WDS62520.1 hypothetical protein UFRH6_93 [Pseudomonas phage UF_RH6]HBO9768473.1 ParB N-terminal domain-containing protein [Pseudomonas aeruginosa]
MALQRSRRSASSSKTNAKPRRAAEPVRIKIDYIPIEEIVPYEFNARNNEQAIEAVKKSIQQFGFLNPIVLDENNVLVAGHTRTEAAKQLGYIELPFVSAAHLTPEQVQAFRLVDNKVAEIATWDDALLAQEMYAIKEMFDFTDFGWDAAEIDCLGQLVSDDCLLTAGLATPEEDEEGSARLPVRRSPATARIVIGEFVFFRPASSVRNFLDGLRRAHNADSAAMEEDIANRLGLLD